jgi:FKBP-type peptidyl-prolyl cis-trans isomerase
MKKYLVISIVVAGIFGLLSKCSNSKYPGYKLSDNGVNYKFISQTTDTSKAKVSDYVVVNMSYRLTDTLLFDSKTLDDELVFPYLEHTFVGDLYDAISLMSVGDSMSFVVVADSFYIKTANLNKLPNFVKAGEPMYYNLKLLKVETKKQHQQAIIDTQAEKRKKEIGKLLEYMRENKISTPPTASGLYYLETKKGRGPKPEKGDICNVRLMVKTLNGPQLYSNLKKDIPALKVEFGKEFDTKGFMEGLGMMRKGGEANLIVPSNIGVGAYGMQGVDGFTTLEYKLKLESITPFAVAERQRAEEEKIRNAERDKIKGAEKTKLENYIKNNKIKVKPQSSGFYYIENKAGKGLKAKHGSTVEVNYKLFTIEGELISSSYEKGQPLKFVLGTGAVIEGWEKGIKLMSEGTKATLIIPSNLAYGAQGKGKKIPPYSTLIFDVELVSVK